MKKSKDGVNIFVGFAVIVVTFAVFTAVIVLAGNANSGQIVHAQQLRRGQEATFEFKGANLRNGQQVTWFVDDAKVHSAPFDGTATMTFVPQHSGKHVVKVVADKTTKTKVVEVKEALLHLFACDVQAQYGTTPQLAYKVDGLLEGDSAQKVQCTLHCPEGLLPCGQYPIEVRNASCDGYEVVAHNATLTVVPKELKIAACIDKTYDQTTTLGARQFEVEGVAEGEEVVVRTDSVQFGGKNVGYYVVDTSNFVLEGKDAHNYTLNKQAQGRIVPKQIALKGLTVADKNYDGTTKVSIAKMGTLQGVCQGDSVAVGSLDVAFESADIGRQKVVVKNVRLVGYDKDNYTVGTVEVGDAEIVG